MTVTTAGWHQLLQRPNALVDEGSVGEWFDCIASRLLNGCCLLAADQPHRLVEIEFYYHGQGHPDPFTHRDPLQRERGHWYFHRTHGAYRGGSFKGLDLTFGDGDAFGGILFRSIETPEGKLIEGPSLLVDYLLKLTSKPSVATLDAAVANRLAWETENVLRLENVISEKGRPTFCSARVGLSLKKANSNGDMSRFVLRTCRYLTEPRRTTKGKLLLVLALHQQGMDADAIQRLTNCPRRTITRYLADYEVGRQEPDFARYIGIDLTPRDLCQLHGTWATHWGTPRQ